MLMAPFNSYGHVGTLHLFQKSKMLFKYNHPTKPIGFIFMGVQLTKCCKPLQKMKVRLGASKIDLSPQLFYITDRSKAILMLWFHLFYILESI